MPATLFAPTPLDFDPAGSPLATAADFPTAAAPAARAFVAAAAISLSPSSALSAFSLASITRLEEAAAAAAAAGALGGGSLLPVAAAPGFAEPTTASAGAEEDADEDDSETAGAAAAGTDAADRGGGGGRVDDARACSTWMRGELSNFDVSTPSSARRATATALSSEHLNVISSRKSAKAHKSSERRESGRESIKLSRRHVEKNGIRQKSQASVVVVHTA